MSNTFFGSEGFGLDSVGTEAIFVLKEHLNSQIANLNETYLFYDEGVAEKMETDFVYYELELVPDKNLEQGEGKDIVDEMFDISEEFPKVNVISSQAQDTGMGGDQMAIYAVSLSLEAWVKATPEEGPQMAYKRATRMVDAMHSAMSQSPTLNGLILPLDKSPQAVVSPIIRKSLDNPNVNLDTGFYSDTDIEWNGYYLCGAGIQYNVKKNSSL